MFDKFSCGFLILTYECNNRCRWCYTKASGFSKKQMPLEMAKQSLKLMKQIGIDNVGLLGGEPTLYKNIIELIRFGKNLGLTLTLYSNGRNLADENFVKQLKEANLDYIHVSVQSCDPRMHEKIVGVKGAFAETRKGIENAVKYRLNLNLSAVLSIPDFKLYHKLMDYFSFAKPRWIFFREVPIVGMHNPLKNQDVLSNKESLELMLKIHDYTKKIGIETVFFARMPLCWFKDTELKPLIYSQKLFGHCHVYSAGNLIVDVNGKVLPCAQWINLHCMNLFPKRKIISKNRFLSEWKEIQEELVQSIIRYPDERCRQCELWGEYCTGGCPLLKTELPQLRH